MEQYVSDALRLLKQLISTPSTSRLETQAADVMAQYLQEWNIPFGREGNNLWAGCPDWDNQRPTVMLNAHIDTVKPVATWTRDPFQRWQAAYPSVRRQWPHQPVATRATHG